MGKFRNSRDLIYKIKADRKVCFCMKKRILKKMLQNDIIMLTLFFFIELELRVLIYYKRNEKNLLYIENKIWKDGIHMKRQHSFISKIDDLREKFSYEITKQPADVKQMRMKIIVRNIIVDFLFSIFVFSLKGAQLAIQNQLVILSVALLVVYFLERVVSTVYCTYDEFQEDNFKQVYTSSIISVVMELTSKVRNKVFKMDEDKGISNVMEHPEVLKISKDYIDDVWHFWWTLPRTISKILTLVVMIGMTIAMELKEGTVKETMFIIVLLFICTIFYFVLGKKRIEVMNDFRKKRKQNEAREDVLFTEIKAIEFSNDSDFRYHAERFRNHSVQSKDVLRKERLKMNALFVIRSFVASGFMIAILLYKIVLAGEVTEAIITSVVAVAAIYSTILNQITSILQYVENTVHYIVDIDKLYPDFKNIYDVYQEEVNKKYKISEVNQIELNCFEFSYDSSKAWKLTNPISFDLKVGEVVLVQGETGCGKSTLGSIIEGAVRMPVSPIRFASGEVGYLKTLTYKTDRAMADNYILNEIVLSDNFSIEENKDRLMEILEGLDLKRVLLEFANQDENLKYRLTEQKMKQNVCETVTDDELILEVMKIRKYNQFSSGQKQRIALAKLLYTLDETIQIIWLDEAFNRLNDEIASKCASFILDYVQRDRKRLVLMASHQLDIIRPFCSKEISFDRSLTGASIISISRI